MIKIGVVLLALFVSTKVFAGGECKYSVAGDELCIKLKNDTNYSVKYFDGEVVYFEKRTCSNPEKNKDEYISYCHGDKNSILLLFTKEDGQIIRFLSSRR